MMQTSHCTPVKPLDEPFGVSSVIMRSGGEFNARLRRRAAGNVTGLASNLVGPALVGKREVACVRRRIGEKSRYSTPFVTRRRSPAMRSITLAGFFLVVLSLQAGARA